MDFGVPRTEAVLQNPIIDVHQARRHRSIRGLGHLHGPLKVGKEGDEEPEWAGQVRPDESAQSRSNVVVTSLPVALSHARTSTLSSARAFSYSSSNTTCDTLLSMTLYSS